MMESLSFVEVVDDAVDFREGRNERGYWSIRRQKAFMHQGGPYPEPFEVTLEDGQNPYSAGKYLLAGGTFGRGKFGLELGRHVKLIALKEAGERLAALVKAEQQPLRAAG